MSNGRVVFAASREVDPRPRFGEGVSGSLRRSPGLAWRAPAAVAIVW